MEHSKKPNLALFEAAVAAKKYEESCTELLEILAKLDSNFGGIQDIDFEFPTQLKDLEQEKTVYFCTRLANAVSTLFLILD
ncbi:O-linked N-acetylglucosaminetransferase [Actinobacillus equuli]|nr:O-linked N-acetylglucosaminetransferase [Actinobacillus equuli]